MRILLLGGQGFIGQNLSLKLLEEGHEVTVIEKRVNPERVIQNIKYVEGDFLNKETYGKYLKDIDVVYHMISTTNANNSNTEMKKDVSDNIIGTINLLDACVENKIKKVIFISSGGTVYGIPKEVPIKETHATNPICSYGITKLAIEKYLNLYNHLYGLDYTVIRLANPYGPYHQNLTQGLINVIINKSINAEALEIWGDGKVERDYIYIDDAVAALSLAKDKETEEKVFNVGSGQSYSICDIINEVEKVSRKNVIKVFKPSRSQDVPINVLDITLARKVLGWEPKIGIAEGINNTYQYQLKELESMRGELNEKKDKQRSRY